VEKVRIVAASLFGAMVGLLCLGALIAVGVIGYRYWQASRKHSAVTVPDNSREAAPPLVVTGAFYSQKDPVYQEPRDALLSGENFADHLAVHIGQPTSDTVVVNSELLVIDA